MTQELRVFGLSEDALRHRLADLLEDTSIEVTLSVCDGHGLVTVTAAPEAVEELTEEIRLRLNGCVYSDNGENLAACVVRLLADHGLTVATAESCTGGLIAAALTDVPGASKVIGTGVVSYSNACKEKVLAVSPEVLAADGAVSAATAGQMARGVRRVGEASIGVSVTGEAGPTPSENHPVGTVFISLADKKRTWVEELHLNGTDRAAIRRQATDRVLWLLWRYLAAFPAVMAGGEIHAAALRREIPQTQGAAQPRLLSRLLPWRGDSFRHIVLKSLVWLAILAVLVGFAYTGYRYLSEADRNRELQSSLGDLYWESVDLTGEDSASDYPKGMLPAFRGLYDRNRDVAGWLYIPGTGVDYPVMDYAEEYYRNHNFAREYSTYGQLYFGVNALGYSNDRVSCIYGKNPGDGQMFSDLVNYRRLAYLQGHDIIQCSTLTANESWQIFAVLVVDEEEIDGFAYFPKSDFVDDQAYVDYIEQLRLRSLFTADLEVSADDRILLLTTEAEEAYDHSGARLVVAARLVSESSAEVTYAANPRAEMPAFLTTTTRWRPTTTTKRATTTAVEVSTTTTSMVTTITTATTSSVTTTAEDSTTAESTTSSQTSSSTEETETGPTTSSTTEGEITATGTTTEETTLPTDATTLPTEATGVEE